jgi:hypothetical protein
MKHPSSRAELEYRHGGLSIRLLLVLYSTMSVFGGMCIALKLDALVLVFLGIAITIGYRIEKALSNLETLGRGNSSAPPTPPGEPN